VSAIRWADFLKEMGHEVDIRVDYEKHNWDLMIALHAQKSYDSICQYHQDFPQRPLILVLTGTDLYQDIQHNEQACHSMQLADYLVTLQPKAVEELATDLHAKCRVIYQSTSIPKPTLFPQKSNKEFSVCVIGHLRDVKDPFRAAYAVRDLPQASKIKIFHAGAALNEEMKQQAQQENQKNPRYHWMGNLPTQEAQQLLANSQVMVLSSHLEGGANVISEASILGVPVIASNVAGNIGLLGEDYSGYFPVGDTQALSELLLKTEAQPQFLASLKQQVEALAPQFSPDNEKQALSTLIEEAFTTKNRSNKAMN